MGKRIILALGFFAVALGPSISLAFNCNQSCNNRRSCEEKAQACFGAVKNGAQNYQTVLALIKSDIQNVGIECGDEKRMIRVSLSKFYDQLGNAVMRNPLHYPQFCRSPDEQCTRPDMAAVDHFIRRARSLDQAIMQVYAGASPFYLNTRRQIEEKRFNRCINSEGLKSFLENEWGKFENSRSQFSDAAQGALDAAKHFL